MDDGFVSLASLVAFPGGARENGPSSSVVASAPTARAELRPMLDVARADIAQELALVRLAALEAFERASAELLDRLARDVLARELTIAPVDLCALAARALASLGEYEALALVVAPSDVDAFETSLPLRADATLEAGDLVIEVREGAFQSRFTLRVSETLVALATETFG